MPHEAQKLISNDDIEDISSDESVVDEVHANSNQDLARYPSLFKALMTSNLELYTRALKLTLLRLRIKIGQANNARDAVINIIRELEMELNLPAEPEGQKDDNPDEPEKFFSSKEREDKYFQVQFYVYRAERKKADEEIAWKKFLEQPKYMKTFTSKLIKKIDELATKFEQHQKEGKDEEALELVQQSIYDRLLIGEKEDYMTVADTIDYGAV